ncbi:SH3 domain-containing protein [Streptomyces sp. NPDC001508]|uniref:SH3 domain-containing protein n=1 Tax=Streptomyces sp. NPDC001508 TaxID=3154656 RepID=UPI00332590BB
MIRRTVKSGLLATIAVFALLPTAASAADAGRTAPLPAAAAAAQPALPSVLPGPARHAPARHGVEHRRHHWHHSHYGRHGHHATHRVHGIALRTAYRQGLSTTGRVTTRHVRLNVRSGPGTGYRVVGHRHGNRLVAITCKTHGSRVSGNRTWYRLAHHRGYVSARYVRVGTAVPWC